MGISKLPAHRHARLRGRGCMVREQQQTNYGSWIGELIQSITDSDQASGEKVGIAMEGVYYIREK